MSPAAKKPAAKKVPAKKVAKAPKKVAPARTATAIIPSVRKGPRASGVDGGVPTIAAAKAVAVLPKASAVKKPAAKGVQA